MIFQFGEWRDDKGGRSLDVFVGNVTVGRVHINSMTEGPDHGRFYGLLVPTGSSGWDWHGVQCAMREGLSREQEQHAALHHALVALPGFFSQELTQVARAVQFDT